MGRGPGSVGSGRARVARGGPRLGRRFVSGADLSGAGYAFPLRGDADTANRKERIRQGLRKGLRHEFGAIEVVVDREGRTTIAGGRHRVEVLQEPEFAGVRLPAVFRRGRR